MLPLEVLADEVRREPARAGRQRPRDEGLAGRKGKVSHPQAAPPTIFTIALLAHLPAVQRERAGLIERLGVYLAQPVAKRERVCTTPPTPRNAR